MFDQGSYATPAMTGHSRFREYSNPGFISSPTLRRE